MQEKLWEGLTDIRIMAERHGVQLDFRRLMSTCHFREVGGEEGGDKHPSQKLDGNAGTCSTR